MWYNQIMRKQLIELAEVLYPASRIEVIGGRKRHNGGKKPHFIVQVNVDGLCLVTAADRSPKLAYTAAGIKLSKGSVK